MHSAGIAWSIAGLWVGLGGGGGGRESHQLKHGVPPIPCHVHTGEVMDGCCVGRGKTEAYFFPPHRYYISLLFKRLTKLPNVPEGVQFCILLIEHYEKKWLLPSTSLTTAIHLLSVQQNETKGECTTIVGILKPRLVGIDVADA